MHVQLDNVLKGACNFVLQFHQSIVCGPRFPTVFNVNKNLNF